MKNKVVLGLIFIFIVSIFTGCENGDKYQGYKTGDLNQLEDSIIRFHVIANSDSKEDQELKLKVRDKVIGFISTKLINCTDKEEARKIINSNEDEIKEVAINEIKHQGYDYNVNTTLGMENFPDKIYGDTVYPQGTYEAYRIIIGSGKGQNWWCVMFPPLCFVDETKDTIKENEKEGNNEVKFKFKLFELFKGEKDNNN